MHQPARLAGGGNQVIPAPGDVPRRMKSEHPVSQRIALVMIEEQPAVKLFAAQRFLNPSECPCDSRIARSRAFRIDSLDLDDLR